MKYQSIFDLVSTGQPPNNCNAEVQDLLHVILCLAQVRFEVRLDPFWRLQWLDASDPNLIRDMIYVTPPQTRHCPLCHPPCSRSNKKKRKRFRYGIVCQTHSIVCKYWATPRYLRYSAVCLSYDDDRLYNYCCDKNMETLLDGWFEIVSLSMESVISRILFI